MTSTSSLLKRDFATVAQPGGRCQRHRINNGSGAYPIAGSAAGPLARGHRPNRFRYRSSPRQRKGCRRRPPRTGQAHHWKVEAAGAWRHCPEEKPGRWRPALVPAARKSEAPALRPWLRTTRASRRLLRGRRPAPVRRNGHAERYGASAQFLKYGLRSNSMVDRGVRYIARY